MTIVQWTSRRPAGAVPRELASKRHREAPGVRGGEQLLGTRLSLGVGDARCERERKLAERPGVAAQVTGPACDVPVPHHLGAPFDSRHARLSSLGVSRWPVSRRGSTPPRVSLLAGTRRARASRSFPYWRDSARAGTVGERTSRSKRRLLTVDLEVALAFEHVDHLVVGVEVIRSASRRDQADELRHGGATGVRVSAEDELPPGRRICRPASSRSITAKRTRRRLGIVHDDRQEGELFRVGDRPRLATLDEGRGATSQAVLSVAEHECAFTCEHIEHLGRVVVDALGRVPVEAEHTL